MRLEKPRWLGSSDFRRIRLYRRSFPRSRLRARFALLSPWIWRACALAGRCRRDREFGWPDGRIESSETSQCRPDEKGRWNFLDGVADRSRGCRKTAIGHGKAAREAAGRDENLGSCGVVERLDQAMRARRRVSGGVPAPHFFWLGRRAASLPMPAGSSAKDTSVRRASFRRSWSFAASLALRFCPFDIEWLAPQFWPVSVAGQSSPGASQGSSDRHFPSN